VAINFGSMQSELHYDWLSVLACETLRHDFNERECWKFLDLYGA